MRISEGLREGDLVDLVLPMISVDEYESKLSDKAVVIAFYVGDEEPARDLNRFIQKSPIDLIDTDISPAPNPDGYYLVFVEMMADGEVAEKIVNLCGTISQLVSVKEWSASLYGKDDPIPLSVEGLKGYFDKSVVEFHGLNIQDGELIFEDSGQKITYRVVGPGEMRNLDLMVVSPCTRLLRLLGEGWDVVASRDGHLLITSPEGSILKVKP